MSKRAVVLLANGFEEIEAVAIIDVLRRAGVEVVIAGVGADSAEGAHGVRVGVDCQISQINEADFDAIILPGGGAGTRVLCENAKAQELIRQFDSKNKIVAAICAAPLALDRAGVLSEQYTCYPGVEDEIKSSSFIDKSVVESRNIITSRGPGTAICFGLYLAEKLAGKECASSLKNSMVANYC